MACSEPKYGHLLMASEQMVWIVSVGVEVILFKKILLLGLYNRFNFRICDGSLILSICCAFLCKSICGLIAMDAAVRQRQRTLKDNQLPSYQPNQLCRQAHGTTHKQSPRMALGEEKSLYMNRLALDTIALLRTRLPT